MLAFKLKLRFPITFSVPGNWKRTFRHVTQIKQNSSYQKTEIQTCGTVELHLLKPFTPTYSSTQQQPCDAAVRSKRMTRLNDIQSSRRLFHSLVCL